MSFASTKLWRRLKGTALPMSNKQRRKSGSRSAALTIPELEQSNAVVLDTLAILG